MERKAGAEPELGAGRSGVEPLPGIGEFDAVEEADRDAPAMQRKLRQVDVGVVGIGADRIARAITGDQRPRHESATAGALELGHASGRKELAAIHQVGRPRHQRVVVRHRIGRLRRADFRHRGRDAGLAPDAAVLLAGARPGGARSARRAAA